MTCTGTTKKGQPCKARALKGKSLCWRCGDRASASAAPNGPNGSRAHDENWDRAAFLAAFEETGMVTAACAQINVGRTTVYEERQRNEDFAIAWADVEERSTERMEREAYRRAVEGVTKPLVSAGKHVTDVKEYSDGLLTFMLKARRPDRYRENVKVEHAGRVERHVRLDLSKLTDEQIRHAEAIAAALDD